MSEPSATFHPTPSQHHERFVESGSSRTRFSFLVPRNGCGSDVEPDEDAAEVIVVNTIVIQLNENIQEIWDTAKRISCVWSTQLTKQVNFKPFQVSMLDVVSTKFQGDDIKCWMDIQKGVYPETTELGGTVSIGEKVSLLIYLQDFNNKADVGVRDCWASAGGDTDEEKKMQVQLTSEEGCLLRPKLMTEWQKVHEVLNGKSTLVTHATVFVFKFPDQAYVHMTCNIEICKGKCKQCRSKEDLSPPELALHVKKVDISTTVALNNLEPNKKQTDKPLTPLTEQGLSISRQKSPEDSVLGGFQKDNVDLGKITPFSLFHPLVNPVPNLSEINQIDIESGLINPNIDVLAVEPPVQAFIVVEDPHGPVNDIKTLPQFITNDRPFPIRHECHPRSTDPNCLVQLPNINQLPLTPDITEQIRATGDLCKNGVHCEIQECFPGSVDPKCFDQRKTDLPPSKPFVSPVVQGESLKEVLCLPGSRDPTCLANLVNPKGTLSPASSYPEAPEELNYDTKPEKESEEQGIYYKPICDKNSNDPRCQLFPGLELKTEEEKSTEGYLTPLVPVVPYPCLPGSLDPTCNLCNSRNPNCKNPVDIEHITLPLCNPDSKNKDCYPSTKPPKIKQQNLILFNCLPGSNDPRCALPLTPHKILDCSQFATHPECQKKEIKKPSAECFPGSTDQKCISEKSSQKDHHDGTALDCILNPQHIECQKDLPKEICGPDSQNPECLGIHTPVDCHPGSEEPKCQRILHDCIQNPLNPKCKKHNKLDDCTTHPQDPKCRKSSSLLEECTERSDDPRCHPRQEKSGLNTDKGKCSVHSTDPECINEHLVDRECELGSEDPQCKNFKEISPIEPLTRLEEIRSFKCIDDPNDARCLKEFLAKPDCNVESNNPLCWPTQHTVSHCSEDSTNPECIRGVLPKKCDPNSNDPNCVEIPLTSDLKDCVDGSLSPGCKKKKDIIVCDPHSNDPQCHEAQKNELSIEDCGHDSIDPKCQIRGRPKLDSFVPSIEPNQIQCTEYSTDPNCFPEIVKIKEDPCTPDSLDPKCLPEIAKINIKEDSCPPNSKDPNCFLEIVKINIKENPCPPNSKDHNCFPDIAEIKGDPCPPNSKDPNCFPNIVEIKEDPCSPDSKDPSCFPEIVKIKGDPCSPDSKDPNCFPEIAKIEEHPCPPDSKDPNCFSEITRFKEDPCSPDSKDPNCFPEIAKIEEDPCPPDSKDPKCFLEIVKINIKEDPCSPDSKDPNCFLEIAKFKENPCPPDSKDPSCFPEIAKIKEDPCPPDSTDPKCFPEILKIKEDPCLPDSKDPNCFPEIAKIKEEPCPPDSKDPNCFPEIGKIIIKEDPCSPESTDPNCLKECDPTSTDPRCHKIPQPEEKSEQSFDCSKDPLHPLCQFGSKIAKHPARCDENSSNPECIKSPLKVLNCHPGSISPECPKQHESTPPCFPGSKDPACRKAEASSVACYPGSQDPDCISETGALKKCTQGDPDCNSESDISKGCYPGSKDPECIKDVQKPVTCYEGSSDPDCIGALEITPLCYPGSQDPRCEFGKKIKFKSGPKDFKCSDDSTAPECLKQRSRPSSSETAQSQESLFKNECFPGSDDPRCKLSDISKCEPGSVDPKCQKTPKRPAFERKTEKPQRKNKKLRKPQTRPTSKQTMMFKDGDFHGDKDPRYHAFHSWLYKPPPKPRPRGKRSPNQDRTFFVHFNGKTLGVVLPKGEELNSLNPSGKSSLPEEHEALLPYSTQYITLGPDHDERPQPTTKERTSAIFFYSYLCWLTFFAVCCFFLAMLIIHLLLRGSKFRDTFTV